MNAADLNRLIFDAARMGVFSPKELMAVDGIPEADRDGLCAGLSRVCEERVEHGGWYWQLTPDARRSALRQLGQLGMLEGQSDLPRCPEWDGFGLCLQGLLRGEAMPPPRRSRDQGDAAWIDAQHRHYVDLLAAAEFLHHAHPSERIAAIRRRAQAEIKLLDRMKTLSQALPTRLFGRKAELRRIYDFVLGRTFSDQPAMLLTGMGGSGKSAVLAHVMTELRGRADAPFVVHLDFDRQLLRRGEPAWIVSEIIRQITAQLTARDARRSATESLAARLAHAGLDRLRSEIRRLSDENEAANFLAQISKVIFYLGSALTEGWARRVRDRRLVVFMDSFEAIGPADGPAVQSVLQLVQQLFAILPNLKTIISGRGVPIVLGASDFPFAPPPRVHLSGLDPEAGAALLQARDEAGFFANMAIRRAASKCVENHPLAIIILGRYAAGLPPGTDQLALLDELARDEGFQAEFAHVFLFRRILDRIAEPNVARLAHPGLVLRRINADLIRLILAEPCLGRTVNAAEAESLQRQLAGEYWLVEAVGDGGHGTRGDLRHDPELRRLMVRSLFAAPATPSEDAGPAARARSEARRALAAKARQVARSAALFYREGPGVDDPAMGWWAMIPAAVREVEATYYEALAGVPPPEDLDAEQVARLRDVLREDLDSLGPDWTSAIAVFERGGVIETEEALLSGEAANANRRMKQEAVLETGTYTHGFVRFEAVDRDDATLKDLGLELVNTFNAARFEEAEFARLRARYLDALFEVVHPDYFAGSDGRLDHPAWTALLFPGGPPFPDPNAFWTRDRPEGRDDAGPTSVDTRRVLDALFDPWGRQLVSLNRPPVEANRIEIAKFAAFGSGAVFRGTEGEPANIIIAAAGLCLVASDADPKDPVALASLAMEGDAALEATRQTLDAIVPRPASPSRPLTVREIDHAYLLPIQQRIDFAELEDLHIRYPRIASRLLRGRNPELLGPLTSLIVQQSRSGVAEISQGLAALNPLWPEELRFGKANPYRDTDASSISDIADKFGITRELCMLLGRQDARAWRLLEMYDQITHWFFGGFEIEQLDRLGS
jgi:hypothetical protein